MLQAYTQNNVGVVLMEEESLSFENINVETGCTATTTPGSTTVYLNKPGYYLVHFNADAQSVKPSTVTDLENIKITMYKNGKEVPYAEAESLSKGITNNISFSTIVRVRPSCPSIDNTAALTFVNTGAASLYFNSNVVVTKLC